MLSGANSGKRIDLTKPVTNLGRLNQAYGRKATDALLHDLGGALNRMIIKNSGWAAARLNGSDFSVLAPRELDAAELGREIQEAFFAVLDDHSMRDGVLLPGGTTVYNPGDTVAELLNRTEGAIRKQLCLLRQQLHDCITRKLATEGSHE